MRSIDLLSRDEYSSLGIKSILDIEKIPYNDVQKIDPFGSNLLLVAGSNLSLSDLATMEQRQALVIGGGSVFARDAFGANNAQVAHQACSIPLNQPLWPRQVAATARSFGKAELRIPLAPICRLATPQEAMEQTILSLTLPGRERHPAVVQRANFLWSVIDLGTAFANLLTESYLPKHGTSRADATWQLGQLASALPQAAYYAAPDSLRRLAQQLCYTRLKRRASSYGEAASEYPVDPTGWLLVELVKALIRAACGSLVRLGRWPSPYTSAACITHDVEPTRYAYTTGIKRLLGRISESGHPATLGLVANESVHRLNSGTLEQLRDFEVICHGLEHRSEVTRPGRAQTAAVMQIARARLEHKLGHPVAGYRNPRLDRSADLLWSLDRVAFSYDSSYPDVDRENTEHFGGGVRVNFPYRPIVEDGSRSLKLSRCLELPVTAPDCIQPIFVGDTVEALREAVSAKAAFLRETCGLYVAIVHAGVFGERDSATREAHLSFVKEQLSHAKVWLTSMGEVWKWWVRREAVQLQLKPSGVELINRGNAALRGLRLILQFADSESVFRLPELKPKARMLIPAHARLEEPHSHQACFPGADNEPC